VTEGQTRATNCGWCKRKRWWCHNVETSVRCSEDLLNTVRIFQV